MIFTVTIAAVALAFLLGLAVMATVGESVHRQLSVVPVRRRSRSR